MTGSVPADVLQLAEQRTQERGLQVEDLLAAGFRLVERDGHGWCLAVDYVHHDGRRAERRLVLKLAKADGNWRWAPGSSAKGAVLPLGYPHARAGITLFTEGESDTITTWRAIEGCLSDAAVIGVAGSNVVEAPANWVAHNSVVVLCFDADAAGDAAAAAATRMLVDAGIEREQVRRLRPRVSGVEAPDMRDLIGDLRRRGISLAKYIEDPDTDHAQAAA